MIEPAFRQIIANDPAISAIATGGVHHNNAPQDERRPRIILNRISGTRLRRLDGTHGMARGAMQVDCLADTYRTAKELAVAVVAKLDNYKGTHDGTTFIYVAVDDERDIPSAPLKGQATPLYGVSIDTRFQFKE